MAKLLLARHEETLEWFAVAETYPGAFVCIPLTGDQNANVRAPSHFKATHRHYKGGLYARFGEVILPGTQTVYTVYGDAEGLNWLREKVKFEGSNGEGLRFTPLKAADV
ncbi:hypothetical protein [Rhizobium sp. MHM7A]|uniref:hypothetical protein n=1 Tax=Rhizobium sp. MHM7A TaxID=2583233 RepID=UPI001980471C|nr:hypothetical protein [Rhizobium sp. MHM7A]